jgi:acetyl esterase/lipase
MLAALAVSINAQTGRTFVVKNSDDGQSELYCSLPRYPNGRAVIACPGGAYGFLSFEKEGTDWAAWFNERGIACFTLRYRLPKGNPDIPVGDAFHAMRLVRDSAEAWHINPYDLGIMGFSAGGHLAATVSTQAPFDARPNFSLLFYPVISMDARLGHAGSTKNFLGDHQQDEAWVKRYSADKNVDHFSTPPALLILSNDDRVVPPVTNAVAYYSAMRKAGNECAMHIYPAGDHGYGFASWFKYHDQMLADLDRWLRDQKAPKADAVRVACIGNSITRGSCINMPSEYSYPAQLQQMLGYDYNVRNFGMPGYTVLRKGDNPYVSSKAWQMARDFQPDIVIVKLGTNDAREENWHLKAEFEKDLQLMIDTLKSLPSKPRIILATPTKVYKRFHGMDDTTIANGVIPKIKKIAKKNNLELLDLHAVVTDEKHMTADGVHPNQHGAKDLAEAVAKAIRSEK